jgi:hypothetical protein
VFHHQYHTFPRDSPEEEEEEANSQILGKVDLIPPLGDQTRSQQDGDGNGVVIERSLPIGETHAFDLFAHA